MFWVAGCPHSNQHDPWMATPVADTSVAGPPVLGPLVMISSRDAVTPAVMTDPVFEEAAATEDAALDDMAKQCPNTR